MKNYPENVSNWHSGVRETMDKDCLQQAFCIMKRPAACCNTEIYIKNIYTCITKSSFTKSSQKRQMHTF